MDNRPDRNESTAPSAPKALSGFGAAGVVCGLFSYLFPLCALFGIGTAAAGIARDRRDWLSWVGLGLSVVMLIVNIIGIAKACSNGNLAAFTGAGA